MISSQGPTTQSKEVPRVAKELPKVRRRSTSTSPVIFSLVGVVVVLVAVIAFLLVSGELFDSQPSSDLERDYMLLIDGLPSDPENPSILMTLAEVEFELGKKAEAFDHAVQAFEFGSDQSGIPLRYAQLMLRNDDFERARVGIDVEIALDTQQANAEPHFLLAQVLRAEGDLEGALETMEQALTVAYMAADMRILYAEMLIEADRTDEAVEQYQEALRYLPGDERAIAALADLGVSVAETETVNPHDTPDSGE